MEKINKLNKLISDHEEAIANPVLDYLNNRKDIILIGKNKISNKDRAPTISFASKKKTSREISEELVSNKIATRNDNFYAWRCIRDLGLDTNDGVVRLSMVHYNTEHESIKILEALEKI